MKKFAFLFAVLFCSAVFAQDLPKIAVYMTGALAEDKLRALGADILVAFDNDGRYKGIERHDAFLAEIDSAQREQLYTVGDSLIGEIGKRSGAKFVCVAAVTQYFRMLDDGSDDATPMYQISARIIDAETVGTVFKADEAGGIEKAKDQATISYRLVAHLLGRKEGEKRPYGNISSAMKLQIPVSEVNGGWGVFGMDFTWYFYKAWHMGFDVIAGSSSADRASNSTVYPRAQEYLKVFEMVVTYNFGYAYYFAKDAGIEFGVSAGFGNTERYRELEYKPETENEDGEIEAGLSETKTEVQIAEFAGPFAKLRWYFYDIGHSSFGVELAYKGMFGWKREAVGDRGDTWEDDKRPLGKRALSYSSRILVGLCVEWSAGYRPDGRASVRDFNCGLPRSGRK
jgi:hypothetical protein